MKTIVFLILLVVPILQSCRQNVCELCFTPPKQFVFEVVDQNGKNVFTNGVYQPEQITIINVLNNKAMEYDFVSENDVNLISVYSIGWKTEIVNLKIDISDQHIFNFYVDVERKNGDCCSYCDYNEISVEDAEFDFNQQTEVYKIIAH